MESCRNGQEIDISVQN
eukprot:Gb_26721 [translate_table: standard]